MRIVSILLMVMIMLGCEQPYTIEEQQATPNISIDALVTDQYARHYVKIRRTVSFYTAGATPPVSGAQVEVSDDQGNVYVYSEESPGMYYSQDPFSGIAGRTYSLSVMIDGVAYTAEEELLPVTAIDSLSYYLDQDRLEELEDEEDLDQDEEGRFYEVVFYAKEPQETEDYYLFKFYRDGTLFNYDGEDVYFADDQYIQENIDGVAFNDWYKLGETATMEMYSITRNVFLFYNDLAITLNNDGGLFSPIPTNPRSNITNGALGVFQVSAVATDSVKVE